MIDNLDVLRNIGFASVAWAGDEDYMCITHCNIIVMVYILGSKILLKCNDKRMVYSITDTTLRCAVLKFMNDNNIK